MISLRRLSGKGTHMIKIERKPTEAAQMAVESLKEAKRKNGPYNTEEVNRALREMFHGKCYICENKKATSCQIEHLKPHKGDPDLKYDWNNLFWSCAHCNNIKSTGFDPILDCTVDDVEKKIAFRKDGYFGTEERLRFDALADDEKTENTVRLLYEVYNGSTPQKKMEATVLRHELREELHKFKEYIRDYYEEYGENREDTFCLIKRELSDSSPFAAFKRWLLRDNRDAYPELYHFFLQ